MSSRRRRAVRGLVVSAVGAGILGLLSNSDLFRTVADLFWPTGEAARFDRTHHLAILYTGAVAVVATAIASALLVRAPTDPRVPLAKSRCVRQTTLAWATVFAVVLLATRLWYLGNEGDDESTFVIMGSHVLDGYLPYLELFENKPPGIFFALAGVMSIFGENLSTVRFFGTLCLLVSAIAGYTVAIRQTTPMVAGIAMTVFCALTSVGSLQQTLTEHLALAAMMPALWLLVARRQRLWGAFVVGVLVSVATLTRMNIAYAALALGVFYLWRFVRPRPDVPRLAIVAYSVGGSVPLALLFVIYWLAGGLDVLVLSIFRVPLSYAYTQTGVVDVLFRHVYHVFWFVRDTPNIAAPAMLFVGIGLAAHIVARGRDACVGDNGLILLVFGAVSLSIVNGGATYGHYLLQNFPLAILLAASGYEELRRRRVGAGILLVLSILIVGATLAQFAADSLGYLQKSRERTSLQKAADFIEEDRCCGELVYAPQGHIIYWYLQQRPPSALVHPTNIARDSVMETLVAHRYVAQDEWRRILERNIGYIVVDDLSKLTYLSPEQRQYFESVLRNRFRAWRDIGEWTIYRSRNKE